MPRRVPDLTKISAMIGYEPSYTLDDILTARHRVLSAVKSEAGILEVTS